ncbi:thioredoxin family protein [Neisseria yangbaofengii]|uniref:thioredoxin family protein n=1 Tax=Neisseria yangbaofengii TaxID=2709396 RepID=UPI0013E9CE8B|nr:thioredoxin family protein [Neisseria yangbaofengii]
MHTFDTIDAVFAFIRQPPVAVLYVSAPNCGVCTVMKPKIARIVDELDGVAMGAVSIADVPSLASEYHVLTAPAVLVFAGGKEIWRGARFIDVEQLEQALASAELYLQD